MKSKNHWFVALLALALPLGFNASAEPSSSSLGAQKPAHTISLEEALHKARSYSKELKSFAEVVASREAAIDEATSKELPSVTGKILVSRYFTDSTATVLAPTPAGIGPIEVPIKPDYGTEQSLRITQLISSFGKVDQAIKSAEQALDLAITDRERFLKDLDLVVTKAFYAALLSNEVVTIAEKSYQDAKNNRALFREHFQQGRAPRSDVLRLERDIVARLPELNRAKRNKIKAHFQLKSLLGIELDDTLVLSDKLEDALRAPDQWPSSDVIDTAYVHNSSVDLKLLKGNVELKQRILDLKDAAYYPNLATFAEFRRFAEDDTLQLTSGDNIKSLSAIGLSLDIPIYQGGERSAQRRQASHDLAKARYDLSHATDQTVLALRSLISDYERLFELVKNDERLRLLAFKTYDMSKQRMRTGQTTVIELNDAANLLTESELLQKSHLHDLHLIQAQILAILGQNSSQKTSQKDANKP